MLSTVQKYGNLLYQHLYQESNSWGAIVSYIAKQKNDCLEVRHVMAWQKELRVMNNGWESWRTRKGLTEEKLLAELEINAQKRERIRQRWKKICGVLYDTSEPKVMIDFCRIRGVFPPGKLQKHAANLTYNTEKKLWIFKKAVTCRFFEVIWWWEDWMRRAVMVKSRLLKWLHHHQFWFPTSNVPREAPEASLLRDKIKDVRGDGWKRWWPFVALTSLSHLPIACMLHHASFHGIIAHLWSQTGSQLWSCMKQHKGQMGNSRLALCTKSILQNIRYFFLERTVSLFCVIPKQNVRWFFENVL